MAKNIVIKSILSSKTFWIAVAQAVLGLLVVISVEAPELDLVGVTAVIKSVLDILLRLNTDTPVKLR